MFFSENSNYYNVFENIVLKLLKNKIKITYITSDKNDEILNLKNDFLKNPVKVETKLKHSFEAIFDKNFKIKDYKYEINGEIENANVKFFEPLKNSILTNDILKISLKDSIIIF